MTFEEFWQVIMFILECTDGIYGKQCQDICGHCRDMNQCNHVNGTCEKGCKPGYQQPTCTQSIWINNNL